MQHHPVTFGHSRALLCAVLAACGGGGSSSSTGNGTGGGANAAVDHSFSYGSPKAATSAQAGVLQSAVANVVDLSSTRTASAALALASFSSVTSTLLGSSPAAGRVAATPGTTEARAQPLAFDPGCVTITATEVHYDHCETTSGGTTSVIDGSFTASADGRTLAWDLTVAATVDSSGTQGSFSYHQSGTVSVTATTITGDMLAEEDVDFTYGGSHYVYGVSEALVLDLTYQRSPACVVAGTLEAKRVWTARPNGVSAQTLPDRAARIVWTGCNQATFAASS